MLESRLEETMEALQASDTSMESAENAFTDIDDDVNAQSRRIMLLEEEEFIQGEKLANTVHKLALMSKDADNIGPKITYSYLYLEGNKSI